MPKTKTSSKETKKSEKTHRGLKVTIIVVLVVVLLLGGLATWFFAYYNSPEKVAFDAVEHLFSAQNVSLDGSIDIVLTEDQKENSPIESATLIFDSSSKTLPSSNTVKLQLNFNPAMVQGEPKVAITLKNVTLRDGVIYFQIGGLIDSLNSFSYSLDEWSALEDYLPIIESIDNEWWQIDIQDIIANLGVPAQQKNNISQVYSCIVEAMNRDSSAELAQLYQKNRFVSVVPAKQLAPEKNVASPKAEAWHNLYEVTLKRQELADFINAIPETETAREFYACFNAVEAQYAEVPLSLDASDFDEISASDIDLPEELRIFLEVSTFGHKLNRVYLYQNTEEYQMTGFVQLQYQAATIFAPDEYRPFSELMEEILDLFNEELPIYDKEM